MVVLLLSSLAGLIRSFPCWGLFVMSVFLPSVVVMGSCLFLVHNPSPWPLPAAFTFAFPCASLLYVVLMTCFAPRPFACIRCHTLRLPCQFVFVVLLGSFHARRCFVLLALPRCTLPSYSKAKDVPILVRPLPLSLHTLVTRACVHKAKLVFPVASSFVFVF
jgi:hypothetical protein